KTSYDADNRPLLVMRSNLWASGYDVDGTDQTSLGQFSGRVQQTYKHSVPRFFVPEHGTMFTLALVRFPPTATKEIQYLKDRKSAVEVKRTERWEAGRRGSEPRPPPGARERTRPASSGPRGRPAVNTCPPAWRAPSLG